MSTVKKLFTQYSNYFLGNLLIILAGFISFPILTRIFSTAEYGMLSLVSITISLGVGFSKFGLQHAALRYNSDFKEKIINLDISYYYTTLFVSSLVLCSAIIISSLWVVKTYFSNQLDTTLLKLLPLVALLILTGSMSSLLIMFFRAENRGILFNTFSVAARYGNLLLPLLIIFYFMKSLYGFFLGYVLSEIIIFIALIVFFIKKMNVTRISFPFLKEALKYSFPLIWMESSNMLLNFGDRYLIQFYLGSASVGIYSAGYNMSMMAQSFLATPLRLAIIPMYLSIWNRDGELKTKKFLDNTLNYYFMLGIPIAIGMSWFGKEIMTVLASSKFQESSIVIPYVIIPLIFHGAYVVYGAGLFIYKKTKILMYLTLLSAVINLSLNTMLIPKFGILGAAYATSIAYLVVVILIALNSYRYLRIKVHLFPLLKYTLLSVLIMLFISQVKSASIKEMLIKISLGAIFYSLGIVVIDRTVRQKVFSHAKH